MYDLNKHQQSDIMAEKSHYQYKADESVVKLLAFRKIFVKMKWYTWTSYVNLNIRVTFYYNDFLGIIVWRKSIK